MAKKHEIGGESPTNGAKETIEMGLPYSVRFKIQGTADYLYHRWNNESVAEKSKAAKGSKAKKTDDVESFVYRNDAGELAIPAEQLRMALITTAKFKQDPRSPRKSAADLYKAALVPNFPLSSVGKIDWDFMDMRRVCIQKNSITRSRPALKAGWEAIFEFNVLLPEYVSPSDFLDTLTMSGRLNGIGDFRPSFGRFQVVHFEVMNQ